MTPRHSLSSGDAERLRSGQVERLAAVAAPAGLLVYAGFRFADGLDGRYGPGFAWSVGHVFFLVAMISFAAFAVAAGRRIGGPLPIGAATAVVAGVTAFAWVIAGDLFPAFADAVPVPDPVTIAGPLLLLAGLLPLFVLVARERMRRWWASAPIFGVIGFALISVDLDLLAAAAMAFGVAMLPLAVLEPGDQGHRSPSVPAIGDSGVT